MKHQEHTLSDRLPSHSGEEIHLLREILRIHQGLMNVFSREVGLPAAKLSLLRLLAVSHPEEPGILEIARQLSIDAAAVTRQIKELEAGKLVIRRPDPRDKRRTRLRLTPKGQTTFCILHDKAHQFEEALGSRLDKKELETAVKVLSHLRVTLESWK